MKKFVFFVFSLMFSISAKAAFIEGLEDIPIMNGLQQTANDSISFGNEESRFVEAVLTSTTTNFANVRNFYTTTLPQMGWIFQGQRDNALLFEREGEVIEISAESEKPLIIRITVKSKI